MPFNVDRRKVLQTAGATVGLSALAGCLNTGDDTGDDGGLPETPGVEIDFDEVSMGGTLNTAISANPPDWDPATIGDTTSNMTSGAMIYEGIVRFDYDGAPHPWLATDWELVDVQDIDETAYEDYMSATDEVSNPLVNHPNEELTLGVSGAEAAVDDGVYGMHYQFNLREGAQFTNGEEVTAENVVRSYDRWQGSARWGVAVQPWYLDARVVDDYTVDIYGQLPDADFMNYVGFSVFPSEHLDVEPGGINPIDGVEPIGSGLWQFEDYEDGSYVTLSRNDDHWFNAQDYAENHPNDNFELADGYPDQPPIEQIEYEIISEDPTRSAALQDGIVDHTYGVASDTLSDYDTSEDYRVSATTSGGYLFFEYPNQIGPFQDDRTCRGVNKMIPRPQIVETVFANWQTEAYLPLSPVGGHVGTHDYEEFTEEMKPYSEYDPDAGSDLVQEAFDERGVEAPYETTIITNEGNDDRVDTVGLIAESMENSGLFDVTIETYEWGQFVQMLISGTLYQNNQIICVGLSSGFSPDGYARAVSHPDNQGGACCNHTHYENETVTELIDGARYGVENIGTDEEALNNRRDTYEELWETLLQDPPVSWVSFGMETDIVREEVVKGWNAYPINSNKYSAALFSPADNQLTWVESDE